MPRLVGKHADFPGSDRRKRRVIAPTSSTPIHELMSALYLSQRGPFSLYSSDEARQGHDNLVCSGPVSELSTGLCKKEAVLHVHVQRASTLAGTWPTRQIQSDATTRRTSLLHCDQDRTKHAPSHERHTANNLVDKPRQIDAVKERHQPRIEPRIAMHLVIVPSEIVDVARPPILGPLLLLAHDPGVLVAVVGDDAPAQDIVGDDEAAGAQQPRAAAGRRPGEDGVEVVR
ncbi:hypothetical protein BN1708_015438, partial [Verticillium longisporum]